MLESTYAILGIPKEFGLTVALIALVFLLAPYCTGADFGIIKVPAFSESQNRKLKIFGPPALIVSLLLFVPFWSSGGVPPVATVVVPSESTSPDIVVIDTWNTDGVLSGPPQATTFSISTAHTVTNIRSYHWNNGRGSPRGNIGLRHDDGTVFGPWEVSTSAGSFGRENVNWECNPNVTIPAGTYTVVDSDPTTWSYNDRTGGKGMTIIKGRRLDRP